MRIRPAENLRGIKVAHDADDFVEGEDVILTLKDGRILDGEEDELQNVNIAEDEAVQASKDRKRKAKAAYTGYDDDEFDESRVGERAGVLGKYDDEYIGAGGRRDGFRLGQAEAKRRKVARGENGGAEGGGEGAYGEVVGEGKKVNRQLLNLDYVKNFEVSDYAAEEPAGFKKKVRGGCMERCAVVLTTCHPPHAEKEGQAVHTTRGRRRGGSRRKRSRWGRRDEWRTRPTATGTLGAGQPRRRR